MTRLSARAVALSVIALCIVVPLLAFNASCSRRAKTGMNVANDEAEMNAAMAKARATVQEFIKHLGSPGPGESGFSIKVPVTQGNNIEHFWLEKVTYDGASFHGLINNDPELVTSVKIGQPWTIAPTEISDWMYLKNGVLVGNESLRALRAKMPQKEREDLDARVPFKFN